VLGTGLTVTIRVVDGVTSSTYVDEDCYPMESILITQDRDGLLLVAVTDVTVELFGDVLGLVVLKYRMRYSARHVSTDSSDCSCDETTSEAGLLA
jgi:hypothetical protein